MAKRKDNPLTADRQFYDFCYNRDNKIVSTRLTPDEIDKIKTEHQQPGEKFGTTLRRLLRQLINA
jgi:hypothetical protein